VSTSSATIPVSDPDALAAAVAALGRPLLVGLDVDGVLAPIVGHADEAALLPGVLDAVTALAARTPVAIVSGRTLQDLERFAFPGNLEVVGTHGLERRDRPIVELSPEEQAAYAQLATLVTDAATRAGDGAWVEVKPAGLVLHVREAPAPSAAVAVDELREQVERVPGAHVKSGKSVVEVLARATSKAVAVLALQREQGAAAVVFVGDDRTDEEVFAALGPADLGIRVGPGDTAASRRLADPPAVLAFVRSLTDRL
jgi:trehalose 6-phosphate phosphatase